MSVIYKVNTFLTYAECKKQVDFKKAIKELEEILECPETLYEITENTQKNELGIPTWHKILLAVQQLVIYEADKFNEVETSGKKTGKRVTNTLILNTINYANNYLKRSDLLDIVITILSNNNYIYYHNTYLNILNNYFPVIDIDLYSLPLEKCREALKVCYDHYKRLDTNSLKKKVLLNGIQKVIYRGCTETHLLFNVKKLVPFLGTVVQDIWSDESVLTKPALDFVFIMCQQISTESRNTLCKLGEKLLPSIVNVNECIEKHKLLLLFIQIYHPDGVTIIECTGDYNKEKWKLILSSIYCNIINNLKPELLSDILTELSCEGTNQFIYLDCKYKM